MLMKVEPTAGIFMVTIPSKEYLQQWRASWVGLRRTVHTVKSTSFISSSVNISINVQSDRHYAMSEYLPSSLQVTVTSREVHTILEDNLSRSLKRRRLGSNKVAAWQDLIPTMVQSWVFYATWISSAALHTSLIKLLCKLFCQMSELHPTTINFYWRFELGKVETRRPDLGDEKLWGIHTSWKLRETRSSPPKAHFLTLLLSMEMVLWYCTMHSMQRRMTASSQPRIYTASTKVCTSHDGEAHEI